jgi:hypothetical protein
VTNEIAPGYEETVFRRMDLGSIKKNIESGVYTSTRDVEHAVMLMFANALMYNNSTHFVLVTCFRVPRGFFNGSIFMVSFLL